MTFTKYNIESVDLEIPEHLLNARMRRTFESGNYEKSELRVLKRLIQKGEVILELGGGIGFISTVAGMNPNTKSVFVVEANPSLIPVIKRTHELNNVKATVFNEMVGPRDGQGKFVVHDSFIASSAAGTWGGTEVLVPITSFQRRVNEIRPSMLIVDIEGAEVDLFASVRLKTVRTVLLELHPKVIGRKGTMKIFDDLRREGLAYDAEFSSAHIVVFKRAFKAPKRLKRYVRMIADRLS